MASQADQGRYEERMSTSRDMQGSSEASALFLTLLLSSSFVFNSMLHSPEKPFFFLISFSLPLFFFIFFFLSFYVSVNCVASHPPGISLLSTSWCTVYFLMGQPQTLPYFLSSPLSLSLFLFLSLFLSSILFLFTRLLLNSHLIIHALFLFYPKRSHFYQQWNHTMRACYYFTANLKGAREASLSRVHSSLLLSTDQRDKRSLDKSLVTELTAEIARIHSSLETLSSCFYWA